jgi:hypothetical protein
MDFVVDPRVTVLNTNPDNVTVENDQRGGRGDRSNKEGFQVLAS